MALKTQGAEAWGRAIEQNVAQARYLAGLVESNSELDLLAPVPLNVVCFRYTRAGWDEERHNEVNREILLRLQEGGIAVPSATLPDGRFAIRVAISNHRSRREDFDALVEAVIRIGRELWGGFSSRAPI